MLGRKDPRELQQNKKGQHPEANNTLPMIHTAVRNPLRMVIAVIAWIAVTQTLPGERE